MGYHQRKSMERTSSSELIVVPGLEADQAGVQGTSLLVFYIETTNNAKDPLAMCDARTARDEDLVPIPVYFPPKDSGMRYSELTEGRCAT
jgi:hypothetical protein